MVQAQLERVTADLGRMYRERNQALRALACAHHEALLRRARQRAEEAGTGIPLSGRVVSVVDYFDALTMDRCCRPAIADDTALEMLRRERARLFDPVVADAFLSHAAEMVVLRDRIDEHRPQFSALLEDETLPQLSVLALCAGGLMP
jgi:putative two-component system response regulator